MITFNLFRYCSLLNLYLFTITEMVEAAYSIIYLYLNYIKKYGRDTINNTHFGTCKYIYRIIILSLKVMINHRI